MPKIGCLLRYIRRDSQFQELSVPEYFLSATVVLHIWLIFTTYCNHSRLKNEQCYHTHSCCHIQPHPSAGTRLRGPRGNIQIDATGFRPYRPGVKFQEKAQGRFLGEPLSCDRLGKRTPYNVRTLWLPAAATSRPRFACSCHITSRCGSGRKPGIFKAPACRTCRESWPRRDCPAAP